MRGRGQRSEVRGQRSEPHAKDAKGAKGTAKGVSLAKQALALLDAAEKALSALAARMIFDQRGSGGEATGAKVGCSIQRLAESEPEDFEGAAFGSRTDMYRIRRECLAKAAAAVRREKARQHGG